MRIWDYPARERGGGDCDQPFQFGRVPSSERPGRFTFHQLVKLTLLKLRVAAAAEAPTNVAAADAPRD